MTADSDRTGDSPGDGAPPGAEATVGGRAQERSPRPAAGGRGRPAKLLPPADPFGTLSRPALEARLAEGASRRLTILVGGAGFGKSTLAARIADSRPTAWYTLDAADRHIGALAAGIVAALRVRLPDLSEDLADPVASSIEASDDAAILAQSNAAAALVTDAVAGTVAEPLVLVLDDLHVLDGAPGAWRFVEALVRLAPPDLHLLVTSRTEPPFGIERLRGQGQVLDLGGTSLAFSVDEIAALLDVLVGAGALDADARNAAAGRIHASTGGWPAAVRLAVEAYRTAPAGARDLVLDRLQHPEGPIFSYLAEEVVGRASETTRVLVRHAVHFERFSAPLLAAVGVPRPEPTLEELARRALFLQPLPGEPGWYALHGLIREYALARLPLPPDEVRVLRRKAADWFEREGLVDAALDSILEAGDPAALARFLSAHGGGLVLAGSTRQVVEAARLLPAALRDAPIERALGEACLARGEWREAIAAFERAAGRSGRLDAAAAWRIGVVHGVRGAYDAALAVYERAEVDGSQPADEALLDAWIASAHAHRGDVEASRVAAERAVQRATACDDPRALAAAHTARGMSHELANDPVGAAAEYAAALAAAERAGDALQIARIRNARGALELDSGNFEAALEILDAAVRHADTIGFAAFHARALVNRGRAKQGVGRFEEAMADFTAARAIYERIGSPSVALALTREGSLHALRGDAFLARSAFEAAVRAARDAADSQALAPALVGLAQSVAADDPTQARELTEQAMALGRDVAPITILLGASRVALAVGDRATAEQHAAEAIAVARSRRDDPGMAAALELAALTSIDHDRALDLLGEAVEIWRRSPAPYGYARNRLIFARIAGGEAGRDAALEAERIFRSIGARGPAADAAEIVEAISRAARPVLRIQALGRFRLVRDGEVVPTTAWQSKKARDLLKILVARRGRPTTRDTFFELLWPDEDPEPLGNRLSVALATVRSVLDPDKAYPAEYFVPADKSAISLDLEHIDLDVETFLAEAAAAARLARSGDRAGARTHLEIAEALYGGDFLEEDPYEDWAVGLREEAQATYIAIARSLAEAAAADGDADGATRYYLRILERDPYDEGAHLGLVAALVAAGRHGEARRRYGFYAGKMEEIAVEAAPFPASPGRPTGKVASRPSSLAVAPG
ncbi:MAG TPA: BTAD domain-containing putative transcriptional regulator [Candidatus Limnocylindrales bacterium]|nr:BTAD domain-containing putative transcriptional regulator [Candidatus Limnocylindrales bacterium]